MPPISSGDVLIGASLSRSTRKQLRCSPCSAHDTFAACSHPLRGALPKGGTGRGRNAPEDAPWLHSSAVGSGPSAAVPCVSQRVPACSRVSQRPARCLPPGAALPPSLAAGPGAGKAAALPGDGGVAAGSAGLRWPRWLRSAPGRAIALKPPFHRCPGPPRPGAGARC